MAVHDHQQRKQQLSSTVLCAAVLPCRYIVSTDGWSASSKLEKYMLLGSTILKQASPLIAYYYAALVPWVHYVPFYELSSDDIMEAIEWLKENDDVARRIARNAKTFALEHLTRPARLCYYQELFTRMGKLYRSVSAHMPGCSTVLPTCLAAVQCCPHAWLRYSAAHMPGCGTVLR
jgi:hypothetical protein